MEQWTNNKVERRRTRAERRRAILTKRSQLRKLAKLWRRHLMSYDPNVGRRIGEASEPGPTATTTISHTHHQQTALFQQQQQHKAKHHDAPASAQECSTKVFDKSEFCRKPYSTTTTTTATTTTSPTGHQRAATFQQQHSAKHHDAAVGRQKCSTEVFDQNAFCRNPNLQQPQLETCIRKSTQP